MNFASLTHSLGQQIDFLLFVQGVLAALWASACFSLARVGQRSAWHWFGFAGALQTAAFWLKIGHATPDDVAWASVLLPLLFSASFSLLFQGARNLLVELGRKPLPFWTHLPLLAVSALGCRDDLAIEPWIFWGQGIGSAVCAAWSWFALARSVSVGSRRNRPLSLAALAWLGFVLFQALVSPLDTEISSFSSIRLWALLGAMGALVGSVAGLELQFRSTRSPDLAVAEMNVRSSGLMMKLVIAGLLLALTWSVTEQAGRRHAANLRDQVMQRARLVAGAVVKDDVLQLSWSDADLSYPAYARIKALMMSLVAANQDLRFVLLAGFKDGKSYFLADSEIPTSKDYSPPGQAYEEASADYLAGMASRQPFLLGPVTDRWGTWIIASVPLFEVPGRGYVNAELDITAAEWEASVRRARLPVLIVAASIFVMLLTFAQSRAKIGEAVARLSVSEQRNSSLVEGSPDIVVLIDSRGRCASINQNGLNAFTPGADRGVGRAFADFWPPAHRAAIEQAVNQGLLGTPVQIEAEQSDSSGKVTTWRVATNPIRDRAGRVNSLVCICSDITDRKRSERALLVAKEAAEAANRAKSDFLAVMSHEIRTPLGAVIVMLDLLRRQPSSEKRDHYTQLAHQSAEALLHILDDLLDASKVESGQLTLENVAFPIESEFSPVLEGMRIRAEAKQLELLWKFGPGLPARAIGDPTRLKQIVANLLSNAIKFTAHGQVSVAIEGRPRVDTRFDLCITVQDTGLGIAPEVQGRLFQKFAQADASTTRQYGGTGLGLSIVKGLVERMHGSITLESALGQGSKFRVEIELAIDQGKNLVGSAVAAPSSPEIRALPKLRVACAEDDSVHRKYLEMLTLELGHEATFVSNGVELLELLRREKFDAVLMDNRMPVMDGFQATRLIRDAASGALQPDIPIIALTANASTAYREKCLAAGMNDYLTKPLRRPDLWAALSRIKTRPTELTRVSISADSNPVPLIGLSPEELWAMAQPVSPVSASLDRSEVSPGVARTYLTETPRRLRELRAALERGDCDELFRAGHTLKGSSHYVAASKLAALGEEIEERAAKNELSDLGRVIARAEEEFAHLESRLRTELNLEQPRETPDRR